MDGMRERGREARRKGLKIGLEGHKLDWTLQSLHTTSKVQWKDGCRSWNSLGTKKSGSAGSQA